MKNYLITILIFTLPLTRLTLAQNLVPNGSFENYSQCPWATNQIYNSTGWFQPHKYIGNSSVNQSSSSDYYNTCDSINAIASVPLNWVGYQFGKTGNGYIGIGFYSWWGNGNAFREYVEVKLNNELIANKKYNLNYFVSLANGALFSTTKFDAYFSNDSLLYTSPNLYKIPVSPQIQINTRVNDTVNWIQLGGSFIATGGERFLTLGNFQDGSLCDTLRENNSGQVGGSYYYIDDVSLELDTLTNIEESSIASFQLYPNPSKGIITISSPQLIQEIIVLELSSKILFQQKSDSAATSIDLTTLDDGIYIVQCKFKNGAIIHKKIVLQKD